MDLQTQVIELYLKGVKKNKIATILNFSNSYICNIIKMYEAKERLQCQHLKK